MSWYRTSTPRRRWCRCAFTIFFSIFCSRGGLYYLNQMLGYSWINTSILMGAFRPTYMLTIGNVDVDFWVLINWSIKSIFKRKWQTFSGCTSSNVRIGCFSLFYKTEYLFYVGLLVGALGSENKTMMQNVKCNLTITCLLRAFKLLYDITITSIMKFYAVITTVILQFLFHRIFSVVWVNFTSNNLSKKTNFLCCVSHVSYFISFVN